MFVLGDFSQWSSGSTEYLLTLPPSINSLGLLPIFSSEKLEYFTANDLHQGFKGGTRLCDLIISKRVSNVLRRLRVTTIGELMIIPYSTLLENRTFGRKSLREVQDTIRTFVLEENFIDYSSYEELVSSIGQRCFKKKRDQEIMSWRLNYSGKKPTLEQIGLHFGITRERARQILKEGDKRLRIKANRDFLAGLFLTVMRIITDDGGVMSFFDLAANLKNEYGWPCSPSPSALAKLLAVGQSKEIFTISGELITVPCQSFTCEKLSRNCQGPS
jgi:hypothetical protein